MNSLKIILIKIKPSVMVYTCNTNTEKLRQKDFCEFKARYELHSRSDISLGYRVEPCLNKQQTNSNKVPFKISANKLISIDFLKSMRVHLHMLGHAHISHKCMCNRNMKFLN